MVCQVDDANLKTAKWEYKIDYNDIVNKPDFMNKSKVEAMMQSMLRNYATKTDLNNIDVSVDLSDYATKTDLNNIDISVDLSDYATKTDLSATNTQIATLGAELNTIQSEIDSAAAGGGFTLLEKIEASGGAFVSFNTQMDSTYTRYAFALDNVISDCDILVRFGKDDTFHDSGYYVRYTPNYANGAGIGYYASSVGITMSNSLSQSYTMQAMVYVTSHSENRCTMADFRTTYCQSGECRFTSGGGGYQQDVIHNRIQFYCPKGIDAGTFKMYGVA